jgi:uncharacterized protein with GYD domain
MATYIVLANFADQCIRNIKDTTKRADVFKELARGAPDDNVVTALGLALGKSGNVRTQTLRAFSQADMGAILSKVA